MRRLPAGDGVEAVRTDFAALRFSPHRHDVYTIGLTTHGVQAFRYRGAERRSLPSEAFVLHPDELHDGRPGDERAFGYLAVYVPPDRIAAALDDAPLPFLKEPVTRDRRLVAAIRAMTDPAEDAGAPLAALGHIAALADALHGAAGLAGRTGGKIDVARLARIRDDLAAAARTGAEPEALERRHGMDRWQIARQFRRRYGVSPYRFLVQRRLDAARAAIQAGAPLAEAAVAAGFADQSHMTRHFRRATGLTPAQWRRLTAA